MTSKFSYHSEQVHSIMENGQVAQKHNIVDIKNGKGTKKVTMRSGKSTKSSTKKLTKSEIEKIRKNIFIPSLFKPCYDCLRTKSQTRKRSHTRKGSR